MPATIRIRDRAIGPGEPCFIIAEAGVNHNGDLKLARELIDVAAAAGADAVKFQTFRADALATANAPKAAYQHRGTSAAESQLAMLRRLELSREAHVELMRHAEERGILFLSTPFDEGSIELLADLRVPAFKISSGELTNHPFLQRVAKHGLPMILSTGMATLAEVDAAVRAVEDAGRPPFAILHCVSNYPAVPAQINLRAMETMRRAFGVPIGYSDHSEGLEIALASVALGATIIEKHYTLDRTLPGPDHAASIEPKELETLVRGIRAVEAALGDGRKRPTPAEMETAAVARKSLVAARDIPRGTVITEQHLAAKRPGTGLPPTFARYVVGRRTRDAIAAGTVLSLEMLE